MKITKEKACEILGVSVDASVDEIRTSYKHLARKWHPDKQDENACSEEATKKFQDVSAAYKKLTSNENDFDEDRMTLEEMMELYRQFFSFGNQVGNVGHCNCRHHHPYYRYNDELSDYDDYDYTDDDSDEEFWESIASRLRNKYEARKYMPKDPKDTSHSGITEEEALRNAQELIEEEEVEKKRKEKKKAKKKKKKEKRKQKGKDDEKEEVNGIKYEDKENSKIPTQQREEKTESQSTDLPNGHAAPVKNDQKNKGNGKDIKRYEDFIEAVHKPVKIVQEDIRPSITRKVKEEKSVKLGKESRAAKNIVGSDDEDQFDANSAFFARAASKAPMPQVVTAQPIANEKSSEGKASKKEKLKQGRTQKTKEIKKSGNKLKDRKEEEEIGKGREDDKNDTGRLQEDDNKKKKNIESNLDSVIFRSRQLAVKGNEFAAKEEYFDAINMYSKAVELDPSDFRFFGNRSYCYDRTGQYENALKDAHLAISLSPKWPKGYFRKGRAFTGLERYQEAEEAFQNVLSLDAECLDAQFELDKVRVRILTDMGFQRQLAEESVKTHGTVQSALEALLAGNVTPRSDDGEDGDDIGGKSTLSLNDERIPAIVTAATTSQPKIKQKCTALWVGNVNSHTVTEKQLNQLFSKYGKLVSVRLLPEKYCAFINYHVADDAANALEKLQGYELSGQNLLIRYPNNPPPGSVVVPNSEKANLVATNKKVLEKTLAASKITGPVNGNECYFWRTTGCVFDSHCRYMHISDHKGIDLAKVRAKYGTHL